MRPFYLKATEDNKEIYIKVVKNKSSVTVGLLVHSDQGWKTEVLAFDLKKEIEKRDYLNFLEKGFESKFAEFDAARKRMIEDENIKARESNVEPTQPENNSAEWRQEILKKITDFRKSNPDLEKDQ